MEKNLPIRLVQKRTVIDDRAVEAGGSSELPKWAQISDVELERRVSSLFSRLSEVGDIIENRRKEAEFIPAILKVRLEEKATSKSNRADVLDAFDANHGRNVIGFVNDTDLLIKVHTVEEANTIHRKISDNKKAYKKAFASIAEMDIFKPTVVVDERASEEPMRASLVNFQDKRLNSLVKKAFELECQLRGIEYREVNYSSELIVYRLQSTSVDSLEDLESFEALETLTAMPKFTIGPDSIEDVDDIDIPIKKPVEGKEYPVVGILDSGISAIPHLKPWLTTQSFTKVPTDRRNEGHGTAVASLVIYGDDLTENTCPIGTDGCYVFDATVMPDLTVDAIEEADLVDHIDEAIKANSDWIKIWNLSLGSKIESDPVNFSMFGKALDRIQRDYGVLICKSAGNCFNFLQMKDAARIANSADSLLALVVGAVAHEKNKDDFAEPFHRSPYTRIGTGPTNVTKPELVHLGGNAGIDPLTGRLKANGVLTFAANGKIVRHAGTSFATPRISALSAGIEGTISGDFNPLLVKALAIHSAKYPNNLPIASVDRHVQMGYGIPSSVSEIVYNDPHEITLILQDTLPKGSWTQILDFPFPTSMVKDGKYYGEVSVTLVTQPLFSDSQGGEYCQSNLSITFGTHDGVRSRTPKGERNTIRYSQSTTNPSNVLHEKKYSKGFLNASTGSFSQFRTLRSYGDDYHPVKKYCVNLSEMTPTHASDTLTAPKMWYLEVKGLFREHIQSSLPVGHLSQDYCLIITIKDPDRKHNVYDIVSNMLSERGFLHQSIGLRSDTHIRA